MKNLNMLFAAVAFSVVAYIDVLGNVTRPYDATSFEVLARNGDTASELCESYLGTFKVNVPDNFEKLNDLDDRFIIKTGQWYRMLYADRTPQKIAELKGDPVVKAEIDSLKSLIANLQGQLQEAKSSPSAKIQLGSPTRFTEYLNIGLVIVILLLLALWYATNRSLRTEHERNLRFEQKYAAQNLEKSKAADQKLKELGIEQNFLREQLNASEERIVHLRDCLHTADAENKVLHREVDFFKDEALDLLNQSVSSTKNLPEWLAKQFRLIQDHFTDQAKFFSEFLQIKQQFTDLRLALQAAASVKTAETPSADKTAEALEKIEESLALFTTAFNQIGKNEEHVMRILGLTTNENKILRMRAMAAEEKSDNGKAVNQYFPIARLH